MSCLRALVYLHFIFPHFQKIMLACMLEGLSNLFVHCCDEINIIQATLTSSVRNIKQPMFHKLWKCRAITSKANYFIINKKNTWYGHLEAVSVELHDALQRHWFFLHYTLYLIHFWQGIKKSLPTLTVSFTWSLNLMTRRVKLRMFYKKREFIFLMSANYVWQCSIIPTITLRYVTP